VDELSKRRLAHNEQLFRAVNEQVDALQDKLGGGDALFVCECSDPECTSSIRLTRSQYEDVRSSPERFVLLPGHALPDLERIVEEHDGYIVVEKPKRLAQDS
jgi:hypothetical protein